MQDTLQTSAETKTCLITFFILVFVWLEKYDRGNGVIFVPLFRDDVILKKKFLGTRWTEISEIIREGLMVVFEYNGIF